jgi:exopolyphosphatase / guanosine-5'-triphosphate,3'-diphosphate pyrophosphatase
VRIGVLDVGSNTIRLLVAGVERGELVPLEKEKVRLSLGEEIERYGAVSDVHIAAAAKAVRKLSVIARKQRVESLDVFLTAPGRQSGNSQKLVAALTRAAGVPVRVLSTDEEGRLAYGGAVATAPIPLPDTIAVCDVGGASTEIAVGSPGTVPGWVYSVDLGSVRLTTRLDSDRFGEDELADARAETGVAFAGVEPPRVEAALAVGGSARAARRLVGPTLGADELAKALRLVRTNSPRTISRRFGVDRARTRILPAGLVILAEVQSRLGVPLHVCDGGIREGAVLAWVAEAAA